jgi:hypothetical protein
MGAEAIAGKAKGKAKPDDATIRKTEPMPTVAEATADPDADTVDADAEADGDGESNGGDDKAASS